MRSRTASATGTSTRRSSRWSSSAKLVLVPNLPDRGVKTDMSWLSDSVPPDELAKLQAAATDRPRRRGPTAFRPATWRR